MRLAVLLAIVALASGCGDEPPRRPDVILVSIDTLRADGLSSYGNPRETSPHLDRLASEGFLFEACYAPAPETAPSHATLFTGLGPVVHRVANVRYPDQPTPGLAPGFRTLAERFRLAGYWTVAITDGGPLGTAWNLHRGFEVHEGKLTVEGVKQKVDRALEILAVQDERPLFLFLHTYQVHLPYVAPIEWAHRYTDPEYDGVLVAAEAETRAALEARTLKPDGTILLRESESFDERDVEHLRALYHGEIAYTDHQLERLWSALRESGRIDRTVIAVTSDHGEEFGEHGFFGHRQLHEESLRVPLLFRFPPEARFPVPPAGGGRIAARVGLVDVFRTLLDAADLRASDEVQGRSLLTALRAGEVEDRPQFAFTAAHFYRDHARSRQSVRDGDVSVLRTLSTELSTEGDEVVAYDLEADPLEEQPVELDAARMAELEGALDRESTLQDDLRERVLDGSDGRAGGELTPEELAELEALGYLESDPAAPEDD